MLFLIHLKSLFRKKFIRLLVMFGLTRSIHRVLYIQVIKSLQSLQFTQVYNTSNYSKLINILQFKPILETSSREQIYHMYKQRLMKQALEASKRKFTQFLLMFDQKDLLSWEAFIQGPKDTPYEGYIFLVKISLSSQYPIMPPKMYFKTKIFHPNIHHVSGQVCLDIIKSQWSPTWTLQALCRALRYLLQNPNQDSPLNCDAANLIRLKQIDSYNHIAKMYSKQHAITRTNYEQRIKKFQTTPQTKTKQK